MPAGIEVYDALGNVVFNTGNRLYRILTTLPAGPGGNFTHAEIGGATIVGAQIQQSNPDLDPPIVTVSGNTVSWGFNSTQNRDTGSLVQILVF